MRKQWRSKETRALVREVTRAGGVVARTARGHLKVTGPAGVAFVGSPATGQSAGTRANALADIRREAGLILGRAA
jgi:hypothetical protein